LELFGVLKDIILKSQPDKYSDVSPCDPTNGTLLATIATFEWQPVPAVIALFFTFLWAYQ
jgi:hypothetical protein